MVYVLEIIGSWRRWGIMGHHNWQICWRNSSQIEKKLRFQNAVCLLIREEKSRICSHKLATSMVSGLTRWKSDVRISWALLEQGFYRPGVLYFLMPVNDVKPLKANYSP